MFDNRNTSDDFLVRQLGTLGLNMKRPQTVEHFFYFPKPDRAELAAKQLRSQGYAANVSAKPCDGLWSVVARGQLKLAAESMCKARIRMEQLAADFGGKYDGWGIPFGKSLR